MTYFTYRHIRGTRSERVYVGGTLVGRVASMTDWRARIAFSDTAETHYRAVGVVGDVLPVAFPSRHDAAEALYEGACRDSSQHRTAPERET
jgi:hypothetical protein